MNKSKMNPGDRVTLNIPKKCIPGDEQIMEYNKKYDGKTGIVLENGFISFDENLGYPHELYPEHIVKEWLTLQKSHNV